MKVKVDNYLRWLKCRKMKNTQIKHDNGYLIIRQIKDCSLLLASDNPIYITCCILLGEEMNYQVIPIALREAIKENNNTPVIWNNLVLNSDICPRIAFTKSIKLNHYYVKWFTSLKNQDGRLKGDNLLYEW